MTIRPVKNICEISKHKNIARRYRSNYFDFVSDFWHLITTKVYFKPYWVHIFTKLYYVCNLIYCLKNLLLHQRNEDQCIHLSCKHWPTRSMAIFGRLFSLSLRRLHLLSFGPINVTNIDLVGNQWPDNEVPIENDLRAIDSLPLIG